MTQEEITAKIYRKIEDPEEIKKFAKKVFVILQNEVWPREKKYDVKINPTDVALPIRMEHEGIINRKETRIMLDTLFEAAKNAKQLAISE